jgi:uncharacterized integral membrane protein
MKILALFLLVCLAVVSVFAALNWSAFTAPATLSVAFGVVQAPLGVVMLGLAAFLTAVFLLFAVFLQTAALLDARRNEKELQAMRDLAEQAEASRFTKLQELLEKEAQKLTDADRESRAEVMARLDKLESALNSTIEQSGNSLAAYIGELEDKVERTITLGSPAPDKT